MKNVADLMVEQFCALGVEVVFTVSGNQNLPLLEAFEDSGVRLVHARHESGAVYMAEAWGQLRERPGVCVLTAGPGHTSGLTALAAAAAAESPVVCVSASSDLGARGAFQEMDQTGLAALVGSKAYTVSAPEQAAVLTKTAWHLASGPVPGPVHVTVPADVLNAETASATLLAAGDAGTATPPVLAEMLERVRGVLDAAERPVVLVRPSLGRASHTSAVDRLRSGVPTIVADSPRGLGDPALVDHRDDVDDADLLILIGPLDYAVAFAHPSGTKPKPRTVLVSGDVDELIDASAQLGSGDLLIHGDETAWLNALANLSDGNRSLPAPTLGLPVSPPVDEAEPLHPLAICREVGDQLRGDDVVVVDGGEFGQWIRAGLRSCPHAKIFNGKLGAIGGSVPQAVGAAIAAPGSRAVVFVGDGAFGYYASEIDTAVREGLDILVIVGNDSRWSAEWHQQQKRYGRAVATDLEARSYDMVVRGFGGSGTTVRTVAELRSALQGMTSDPPGVRCLNAISRSLPISDLEPATVDERS